MSMCVGCSGKVRHTEADCLYPISCTCAHKIVERASDAKEEIDTCGDNEEVRG